MCWIHCTSSLPSFLPSLQAEETKVLRLQLELSQAKGELERRLQEKEEETEAARYHILLQHFQALTEYKTKPPVC